MARICFETAKRQRHEGSCVVNQTEMLHQMCHEVLAEADIRAICKHRGMPNQAASSRSMLEALFLSDTGVAVVMGGLDRTELALLHLLKSQDKPVDVAFFRRLGPPQSERWSYGTFSQRFEGVFTRVKDRLLRGGSSCSHSARKRRRRRRKWKGGSLPWRGNWHATCRRWSSSPNA